MIIIGGIIGIVLQDAHIILVCAGKQRTSVEETQLDLFEKNAPVIQTVATYAAEFNPKAVFCIATQPINSLVPLVSEVSTNYIMNISLILNFNIFLRNIRKQKYMIPEK